MTILCEPDQERAARLLPSLRGTVRTVATLPDAAMAMVHDPSEKVVVIGSAVELAPVLSFSGRLRSERPDASVILVRDEVDDRTAAEANSAGVRAIVPSGYPDLIADAFERAQSVDDTTEPATAEVVVPSEQARTPLGRIVVVFAAKGGCGKTTMATNLAVALGARESRTACLVDLDLAFGDVAITMHLAPRRTLSDAVESGIALDSQIDELITPSRRDLDCVLAPVEPGDAEHIPAALVTELLTSLRRRYDYVVVDTPAQFSEHVLAALDLSDHQVLLTTPEIPALKNLRLALDTLDLLSFPQSTRSIVLNRADARGCLSFADVEQAVQHAITAHIPASHEVPVSINRGEPIVAALPEHPVSKAITDFASRVIAGEAAIGTPSAGRRGLRLRKRSE